MKKFFIFWLFLISIVFSGCSSSKSSVNGNNAPVITGLDLSQSTFSLGEGGGSSLLYIFFDFFDQDRDVKTIHLSSWREDEIVVDFSLPFSKDLLSKGDERVGEIAIMTGVETDKVETQYAEVYVEDSMGNKSNRLSFSVSVQ